MLSLDIPDQRIGAYRMGSRFQMPERLRDDRGADLNEGDFFHLEPYPGVWLGIAVEQENGHPVLHIVDAQVDECSGALIFGQPMATLSLRELLQRLSSFGLRPYKSRDGLLVLNDAATLGVFGDHVDMVQLGGDLRYVALTSRLLSDPLQTMAITRKAAEATGIMEV